MTDSKELNPDSNELQYNPGIFILSAYDGSFIS